MEDLPAQVREYKSSHVLVASEDPSELVPLSEVERRYIERVMQAVGGNKRQAARILGLDRATLYRRLGRGGGESPSRAVAICDMSRRSTRGDAPPPLRSPSRGGGTVSAPAARTAELREPFARCTAARARVGDSAAFSHRKESDVPRPSANPHRPPAHEATSLEILVMEDDPEMGALVRDALRRDGHRVLLLENGLLGMAHLHTKLIDRLALPDLVVADIVLPGFKGLDILASLRRAGSSVPVILMTAFPSEQTRARAAEMGAMALLDEPFDLDSLRGLVASQRGRS